MENRMMILRGKNHMPLVVELIDSETVAVHLLDGTIRIEKLSNCVPEIQKELEE